MNNLELDTALLLIVTFFGIYIIVYVIKSICTGISNSYVNKNKERLLNDNEPLSYKCKDLGVLLLEKKQFILNL